MFKGFRDFILRGNVMDLAVAVVIGAAFTAIVNALVTDIVNPLIAAVVHKPDFSALIFDLHGGKIKYGDFMNAIISFLLIAAVVYFVFVLPVNALMKKFRPRPGRAAHHPPLPRVPLRRSSRRKALLPLRPTRSPSHHLIEQPPSHQRVPPAVFLSAIRCPLFF